MKRLNWIASFAPGSGFLSRPLFGGNTNQISPSELRAGVRVRLHVLSPSKDGDLRFSDLEPFSFHFEPQRRHGDLLITERNGWEAV